MKISELKDYKKARYTEYIPEWFANLEYVRGTIEADWSGEIDLFGTDGNKYYSLKYYYGSCSGCDHWENKDLSDEQIQKEIIDLIIEYSKEEYEKLLERLKD